MKAGTGLKWEGSLGHTLNKNVTHLLVETRHGVYSAAFLPSQVTSTTEALQFFRSNVFLIFLLNLKCVIFLLAYNCFTTLGYFLLYNKVNQLLIHVRCWCLVIQLCLTLCNPMDCSPLGSSVHGVLQARIPEWVAISSSRGSSRPRD